MQNETIQSLQKAIATYQKREIGYQETIERLADTIESIRAAQVRLLTRSDRFKREMGTMKKEMEHMAQAILDMAATQKINTQSRKKFEAGYWKRIGE